MTLRKLVAFPKYLYGEVDGKILDPPGLVKRSEILMANRKQNVAPLKVVSIFMLLQALTDMER